MSPIDKAKAMFNPPHAFFAVLRAHLQPGRFVYSTPLFFVCGRAVESTANHADIQNCNHLFDPDRCDAWYVHVCAGDMRAALSILPWPLPLIGYERKGKELRFVSLIRICSLKKST